MLLKNLSEAAMNKKARLPDNPVSFLVVVNKVMEKTETNGGPFNFSIVPLEAVEIPYVFKSSKASSKNIIKAPVKDAKSIHVEALCSSMFFSIFKHPGTVTAGEVYKLQGVFYTIYQTELGAKENKEPRNSFMCTQISPVHKIDLESLVRKHPFSSRSIDIQRDLPGHDAAEYISDKSTNVYRFVYVKVPGVDIDQCNDEDMVYGRFTCPELGEALVTTYTPVSEKGEPLQPIIALTGGRKLIDGREVIADNQFMLQQNQSGKQPIIVLGQTKLYAESLSRLQVSWPLFGATLLPYFEGDALCLIDREKTRDLLLNDNNNVFTGAVGLLTNFRPNLVNMARACGFRLDWQNCVKLYPKLENPVFIASNDLPVDIHGADAINLVAFTGNVSQVPLAMEQGLVQIYAVTNRPFTMAKRKDIQSKDQDFIVKELLDDAEYTAGKRVVALFLVPDASVDIAVADIVRYNNRGDPPVMVEDFQKKRMKRE